MKQCSQALCDALELLKVLEKKIASHDSDPDARGAQGEGLGLLKQFPQLSFSSYSIGSPSDVGVEQFEDVTRQSIAVVSTETKRSKTNRPEFPMATIFWSF